MNAAANTLPAHQPLLATPLTLRGITTRNRVVISPMMQYHASFGGVASDFHLVHLGKFALGGAGIVFTEATAVEPRGRISCLDCGIWNDEQTAAFARIAAFIRASGALPAIQLAHAGRKGSARPTITGGGYLTAEDAALGQIAYQTVGPTSEPLPGWPPVHALLVDEIASITAAFAAAARRADQAGFDILEIHGAHGYLLASFLSPVSNTRTDEYGGDRVNRMRFALEVTRAVRAVWPAHKPLFFRVSAVDGTAEGWNLDDTVALAGELKASGVDVIDCSSGGLTGSPTAVNIPRGRGFQVPYAVAVRRGAQVPTMAVGLILDGLQAEKILTDGDADLIAIGRQALYDPFWGHHAIEQLGADAQFERWPEIYGWWLRRRAASLR